MKSTLKPAKKTSKVSLQIAVEGKMEELKKVPGLYEFVMKHGFVAGGAIRDLTRDVTPKDWDVFFKTKAAVDEFTSSFGKKMEVTGIGNYNFANFQFITIRHGTPQQVIDTFDWNVNMVFYDLGNNSSRSFIGEFLHINTKSEKPLSAMIRLPYMLQKGFKIEDKEMLFALSFVSSVVNLQSEEAVEKQHEYLSAGGFTCSVSGVVQRANAEAIRQSPLMKALT